MALFPWQRLRSQQWLRQSQMSLHGTKAASAASWLPAVGVLAGIVSTTLILGNDDEENEKMHCRSGNDSSTISNAHNSRGSKTTATSTLPVRPNAFQFSVPKIMPAVPQFLQPASCACEEKEAFASTLFGRKSQLPRRTNTIVLYKSEVSRESVRRRYKVNWKKPLGQGGFGAVYEATDRRTGEKVALKQISKKHTDDIGFQREMDAFLHLRRQGGHPNICGLIENFDEGNYFYFSLDLISGGEMFDHLIRSGPYSEEDAARLVGEVASALNFMHGIGFVHGDLKPENIMLSSDKTSDAVVKLIDFGCAQVSKDPNEEPGVVGLTTAYGSPEMLKLKAEQRKRIDPPLDMWALGVILHIMLVGCHPFDIEGEAPDAKIARDICTHKTPEALEKDSPLADHLSASAMDLIRSLLEFDPQKRITAAEMLEHPWVRGETAKKDKISDSDKKLSKFRVFKSKLEVKVFEDIVSWADEADSRDVSKRTSLIERSFRKLDEEQKGFITAKDLKKLTGSTAKSTSRESSDSTSEEEALSLSGFSNLLSDNMKDTYFPSGALVYQEGEIGNSMLFINSGKLLVSTKDGYKVEVSAGNFIGEGALISPERTRNATVKCITPVHAIEVSRENFEKFLKNSEAGVSFTMREKDKKRAVNRTKNILRRQRELKAYDFEQNEFIFNEGETAKEMYIIEDGIIESLHEGHVVAKSKAGDMFGVGSLVIGRNRNSAARCASKACRVHKMMADDFFEFINSSPVLKSSVYDVFLRKEFAKAVAHTTKKSFPWSRNDLREVFDSIDTYGDGYLTLEELRELLVKMDENIPEEVVEGILNSLDIDASGVVEFNEFCHIFLSREERRD